MRTRVNRIAAFFLASVATIQVLTLPKAPFASWQVMLTTWAAGVAAIMIIQWFQITKEEMKRWLIYGAWQLLAWGMLWIPWAPKELYWIPIMLCWLFAVIFDWEWRTPVERARWLAKRQTSSAEQWFED